MADKRIQDLPSASSVQLNDLFVLEQSGAAMSLTGQTLVTDLAAFLDGHGGIANVTYTPPVSPSLDGTLTLTMADQTTYDVVITNGNGIASIAIAYGISSQGTTPGYVTQWANVPVPPTDASPYQWTRIRMTDKAGAVTDAYSVTMKAVNPTMSIGSVNAETGANADATVTNSGTSYNPVFNFDFTLPKGDKGDTGDYIDPVVYFGTSTSATTEPSTWYNSPSSLSYSAGNFIWQKTEYTLHEAQTVQGTEVKVIGYIGQNGTGAGTVTQITVNGDVFTDDGTGNVTMNLTPENVGAIEDPATKSNGQVLTWDSSANEWVATTPSTGIVNTVNNVGVTAGTTNIALKGSNIPVSASDSRTIDAAIPVASSTTPAPLGTAAVGTGTTWARADHVHAMPTIQQVNAASGTGLIDLIYPVGSIYMSTNSTSPQDFLGGEWTRIEDAFLLSAGSTYTAGDTGGNATHSHSTQGHTLTVDEIPSHNHPFSYYTYNIASGNVARRFSTYSGSGTSNTQNTGGGGSHSHGDTGSASNMPPYLVVYMWTRIA